MIRDSYSRPLTSMRISITSRCNYSCRYCHHEGISESAEDEMAPEEIERIVGLGARFGVSKIKLTGGEPLIRGDVVEVVERIASLPGIQDVSMTTNGYYLAECAEKLRGAGMDRVNVSLDTLKPKTFKWLTGSSSHARVLRGIESAVNAKLTPVKINMVLMRGVNDGEIERLVERYSAKEVIVQLIELVESDGGMFEEHYYSLDSIEGALERRAIEMNERRFMHGRKQYKLNGAWVEVIKPMHNSSFCAHCTRLRVTSDGKFKPCLMRQDNHVSFLHAMRSGASDEELEERFKKAVLKREPFFKPSLPE